MLTTLDSIAFTSAQSLGHKGWSNLALETRAKLPLMLFRDNNSLGKAHVIVCELTLQMGSQ